jgi:type I restriction enzyme R subunit
VMTAVLKDDVELFKQFSDNESFRRWLADTIFALTYDKKAASDKVGHGNGSAKAPKRSG